MSDNIVKLYTKHAAKDPDSVLELAHGEYKKVAVLGVNQDDNLEFRASLNLNRAELLWLLEQCKLTLLHVSIDHEDEDDGDE